MNRAFRVILIGVSRNPERVVVVMYNNVEIISDCDVEVCFSHRLEDFETNFTAE